MEKKGRSKKIDVRKIQVLKIIVEQYLQTGEVTGSKSLLKKHEMGVSSATVRNDMASLENMGLIFQPYNSAGRLPTPRGIRVFVDYLMEHMPMPFIEAQNEFKEQREASRLDDALYLLVSKLTKTTGEITFACIPEEGTSYYLGLSQFLQKNTSILGEKAYSVIKMLEDKHHFIDFLNDLDIPDRVVVFIGDENLFPDMESCAMIVKRFTLENKQGYIGILGSLKMDYAFNIAALRNIL